MSLSELKRKISKLLEEDEEFRYFVASKVGLLEILDRFRKYDEKFNEILKEIRELRRQANEHDRKFNEILARLDEHDRKFNEIVARLDEHDRKFNEIVARLDEHDRKFNEIMKEIRDIRIVVDRLAISLEEEASEVVSYFLRNKHGIDVDLGVLHDRDIEVNIYGAVDDLCIIGEVAVRIGIAKVRELIKKVKYLVKMKPDYLRSNVVLVLYGARAMPGVVDEAKKYGIWVVTATKELTPLIKTKREDLHSL